MTRLLQNTIVRILLFVLVVSLVVLLWPAAKEDKLSALENIPEDQMTIIEEQNALSPGDPVILYIPPDAPDNQAGGPVDPLPVAVGVVLEVQERGYVISDPEGDTFFCLKTLSVDDCKFIDTRDLNDPTYQSLINRAIKDRLKSSLQK